jgi:glycosyltransferase involved in cell wall biosynthesis
MKVLFLQSRLSERGGADRWLLSFLADLRQEPVAGASVASHGAPEEQSPPLDVETCLGVDQIDPDLPERERSRIGPVLRVKGLGRRGLRSGGAARARKELQRVLEDWGPDLIVVNDVVDPDLLGQVAASGRGVVMLQDHRSFCPGAGKVTRDGQSCQRPMGATCADCFEDPAYGERLIALTERRFAALAGMRHVVVLSRYMRAQLGALGFDLGKVSVIPPFVDTLEESGPGTPTSRQGAQAKQRHVIAGRLAEHKGIRQALAVARDLGDDAELVVAGNGPLEELVRGEADATPERLRFVGWLDRPGMTELLEGAFSLWLPSTWAEPFGIIGLEALSLGVPVIASDVGGVRDWLRPELDGLLVTPGDRGALSAAVGRLMADPDWAKRLGAQGQERVRHDFSPGAHRERWLDLFKRLAR